MIYFKTNFFLQRLMEEIKRNMDNIENCEKNAKAYIDSVKVFFCSCFFHRSNFICSLSWLGTIPYHLLSVFRIMSSRF